MLKNDVQTANASTSLQTSRTMTSAAEARLPPMNASERNDSGDVLWRLSEERACVLWPAMAVVALLMVLGLAGNAMVCLVFGLRLKAGTQNSLILCLALFDLLSCLVAMPAEIVDMRFYFTFPSDAVCKLLRFVTHFSIIASNLTLIFIAVDRFRKICRPLGDQMTSSGVKVAIGVTNLLALVFAAPACVVYGLRTAPTSVPGVLGRDCSTSDAVIDTVVPLLYNCVLFVGFVLLMLTLAVLYCLVWKEARRHRRYMKEHTTLAMVGSDPRGSVTSTRSTVSFIAAGDVVTATPDLPFQPRPPPEKSELELSAGSESETSPGKKARKDKTTLIAFSVTIIFILSLLPHLSLQLARIFVKNFDHDLTGSGLVAYNLFLRSYFVNSVLNPLVYGLMNYRFRQESWVLLNRLFCKTIIWNANRVSSNA